MVTFKKYITVIISFLLITSITAQEKDTIPDLSGPTPLSGIPDESVEVIKAFQAKLADASRVSISPVLPKIKSKEKAYQYNISIVPLQLRYPEPIIRPLAITADKPKPLFSFYTKVGAGSVKSIFGDVGLYKSFNKYDLGIKISHHSVDNSENQSFQKYNTTGFNSFVNYLVSDNHQLGLNLDGNFSNRHFYYTGYDISSIYSEEASRRMLTNMDGQFSFSNIDLTDLDLNYEVRLGSEVTKITNADLNEIKLTIEGKVEKVRSENTSMEIAAKGEFASGDDYQINVIEARPTIIFNVGRVMASVGGAFLYANEKAEPWIDVELAVGVSENFIQAFVGSNQGYLINGLISQSRMNPYIEQVTMPALTNVFKDFYGGVRGEFGVIAYNIKGGFKQIENQALFVNAIDRRKFLAIYDNLDVPYLNGNLEFHVNDKIVLSGWANQNFYTAEILDEVIHLPALELGARGKISLLDDKINIISNLHLADKSSFINEKGAVQQLNLLTDLNAEVNVRISEHFGVWAQANNILDNEYERWEGYPSIGINLMGGILLKF